MSCCGHIGSSQGITNETDVHGEEAVFGLVFNGVLVAKRCQDA